jgi:Thioredoxin
MVAWSQVDCTQEPRLCQEHQITGFPSIRVFRKGSDDITMHGVHEHESYRGAPPAAPMCRSSLLYTAAGGAFVSQGYIACDTRPDSSGSSMAAGDRTKDSLLEFAEALVPSAGQPHRYVKGVTRIAKTPGCNLSGATIFVVGSSSQQIAA